jgi:hypothetical protein
MADELMERIATIAIHQHGLLTKRQADDELGPDRLAHWTRTGRLHRVQPRVFALAGAPPTWHQHLLAAQLAAGGVVSHRAAGELWGLVQPSGYVEVSIRAPRQVRLQAPALVHRIEDLRPDLAVKRNGLTVTDPGRTLIDLGLVLPNWSVSRALTQAVTSKLVSIQQVAELRDALGRPGRDGSGVMRAVLDARTPTASGEESVLEAGFVDLTRRFGLPMPTLQHELWDRGRFVARIDAAYVDQRVAVELDGYATHSSPEAFQRDRERQNQLVRLGWLPLRFTWADIHQRGARTAEQVRTVLRERSAA